MGTPEQPQARHPSASKVGCAPPRSKTKRGGIATVSSEIQSRGKPRSQTISMSRPRLPWNVPRMPKCAVVAFDELDTPLWPRETAALEHFAHAKLRIERVEFDPYIGFAVLD